MQTVCLVGKPNVGKSSIFNRLIKENKSIIMDTPGVTRDRIYGKVEYNNKRFHLIDTGGISLGDDDFQKDTVLPWGCDSLCHGWFFWHVFVSGAYRYKNHCQVNPAPCCLTTEGRR